MASWKEQQLERKLMEQELEDMVWSLRVAIGRTKDKQEIERLGDEIDQLNQERKQLGFIGNKNYEPSWLSAYNF